jgi:hypothetical protein
MEDTHLVPNNSNLLLELYTPDLPRFLFPTRRLRASALFRCGSVDPDGWRRASPFPPLLFDFSRMTPLPYLGSRKTTYPRINFSL